MVRFITYVVLSLSVSVLMLNAILPVEISVLIFALLLFDLLNRYHLFAAVTEQQYGWRIRYITTPVLKLFKKVSPKMSETEREAIDAGSVWWDGELFSGKPKWKKLRKLQLPRLSEEEQAFLDGPVDELCSMLDDWQITHEQCDLPEEVWKYIKENKFLSMIIPKAYGGYLDIRYHSPV